MATTGGATSAGLLRRLGARPRALAAALGLAALVAAALLAVRLRSGGERDGVAPPGPAAGGRPAAGLATAVVARKTVEEASEAVGTVRPRVSATLASKVTGRVVEVRVRAGDPVARGQVLLVLAGEETLARVRQARAAVQAAEATLADAERDAARMRELAAAQVIARREVDAAEARADVARARAEEARSGLAEAEAEARELVVRAPDSGVVAETLVDAGDVAAPGRPLLTYYDPRHLRLEASVREELARRLAAGQRVEVVIDALEAELEGRVEVVVPEADPATRAFLVKVALPARPGLYPGMFGRLRFSVGPTEVLAVPRRAVQLVGQLETVDVVEGGVARTRQVRTGKVYGDLVEVLAGLEPGERVVLP